MSYGPGLTMEFFPNTCLAANEKKSLILPKFSDNWSKIPTLLLFHSLILPPESGALPTELFGAGIQTSLTFTIYRLIKH